MSSQLPDDQVKLLESLQIYQAELESQNEELRVHQQSLEDALAEIRTLFSAVPLPLLVVNEKGTISQRNELANRLLAPNASRFLADDIFKLVAKDDQEKLLRGFITASKSGYSQVHELRISGQDGQSFLGEVHITRRPQVRGKALEYICAVVDQTELINAKRTAEEYSQSKSRFLANMSHEIRTPMHGVIGLTELALNEQLSPEVRDHLNMVKRSATSLLGILNDILDFSKIEAGQIKIENIAFDLTELMTTLNALYHQTAVSKDIKLNFSIAPGTPTLIQGDPLRLQQVLSNLVSNAIKFTAQGKVSLHISCLKQADAQAVLQFSVEDEGIGIDAKHFDSLFEPFNQLDATVTRKFGGTGLGLAICHHLLDLMGCRLNVQSVLGKGSSFSFKLPFKLAPQAMHESVYHAETKQAGTLVTKLADQGASISGARVLVAEDNLVNQTLIKRILSLAGIDYVIAGNGAEALQHLAQNQFDAILMDLHMPVMDGAEATRRIRSEASYKDLPIIALTAGVTEDEKKCCYESGMNDFITKPVMPETVIKALVRWIR